MADQSNWERERMRDRGNEGSREHWGRGREDWRASDWDREPHHSASEERDRPWGREGRYGYGEERYRRRGEGEGRYGEEYRGGYGGGENRWEHEGRWNEGSGYGRDEYREGRERGEPYRRGYLGREGGYSSSDFTRRFGTGTEYFGTGQRGFGTTWGGQGYSGWGGSAGYSGGLGSYGEQGRYAGRGPKGYQRSDDRIREDVCERLTRHPDIDASEIEIQVRNGEVTLTGTVERREEKRMAEDVAESVSGVKDVHNQLRMQPQGVLAGQQPQTSQNKK